MHAIISIPGENVTISTFAIRTLLPNKLADYYSYLGSLTTPPCAEVVIWNIFRETVKISEKQASSSSYWLCIQSFVITRPIITLIGCNAVDRASRFFGLQYSKPTIRGLTQDWLRESSFTRLECGVHDSLHIYPLCGIFYFPCHIHQTEGTIGFWSLF